MLKILFLVHRYLGIGLGLIMLLWCLSGFVMMYKPYPELSEAQSLELFSPLDLSACCIELEGSFFSEGQFNAFQIQMLDTSPILYLESATGRLSTFDLRSGESFYETPETVAQAVSTAFQQQHGINGEVALQQIQNDQWTVYGGYNAHRPLYKFSADDQNKTQWYVSSRTGEIVQYTTSSQRLWGYLGAVVHWLYPTMLREHVQLWGQTVIWLSILGIFLTCTGLYFGIKQYKTRKSGKKSPYKGWSLWHHYTGLLFGVLTLTWVLSGLFSMNPWGALEGEGAQREVREIRGESVSWAQVSRILDRIGEIPLSSDIVKLEGQVLLGKLELFTVDQKDHRQLIDSTSFEKSLITNQQLETIAEKLADDTSEYSAELIEHEDTYYYHHHNKVELPAYRVIVSRPEENSVRYYLSPENGSLLRKIDSERRWYRWLFSGLHRGDFSVLFRSRPFWDIFMWSLLLGVTATCFTGVIMGVRRVSKSLR